MPDTIARLEERLASGETDRLPLLIDLVRACARDAPLKGLEYGQQALTLARETNDPKPIGASLHFMGQCHYHLGNLSLALTFLNEALDFGRAQGLQEISGTLAAIASVHRQLGNYEQSLAAFLEAMRIDEERGNLQGLAFTLNNMANLQVVMRDFPQAAATLERALAIYRPTNDELSISACLNNLSSVYKHLGQFEVAIDYAQRALAIKERLGHELGISISLHNLGVLHVEQGQYTLAVEEYQRSLSILERLGEELNIALVHASLGAAYTHLHDFENAHRYLDLSLATAERLNARSHQVNLLNLLAVLYQEEGDYLKALETYKEFTRIQEELLNSERTEKLATMQARYEKERIEHESEIYRLRYQELASAHEELKTAQASIMKLERNAAVAATAVTASHEINQPLQVITGSLDLLEISVPEPNERQTRHFAQAREAVKRIEGILSKLLAIEDVVFEPYSPSDNMLALHRKPNTPLKE
jgi:tetratricopeptide (TPR) repeat protein